LAGHRAPVIAFKVLNEDVDSLGPIGYIKNTLLKYVFVELGFIQLVLKEQ